MGRYLSIEDKDYLMYFSIINLLLRSVSTQVTSLAEWHVGTLSIEGTQKFTLPTVNEKSQSGEISYPN